MTTGESTPRGETPTVAVFAPSPLFTVTIENRPSGSASRPRPQPKVAASSLSDDQEGLDSFVAGGPPSPEIHFHAGGQGFWVARMIQRFGAAPVLCAPFGGESGHVLQVLAREELTGVQPIACAGANGGYVHDRRSGHRTVVATVDSPVLGRHELDDLYGQFLTASFDAHCAVLTGPARPEVLDPDVYRRLALDLGRNGRRVVADLSGACLRALRGGVELLKVSSEELRDGGYCAEEEVASLASGVAELRRQGLQNVVVSCGARPALAWLGDRLLEIRPPRIEPVEPRGAGDSMTAALAVAIGQDLDLVEALRRGAAAGALNVTRHGLGTGVSHHISRWAQEVTIREIDVPH